MTENIEQLLHKFPLLNNMRQYEAIDWINPEFGEKAEIPFTQAEVFDVADPIWPPCFLKPRKPTVS